MASIEDVRHVLRGIKSNITQEENNFLVDFRDNKFILSEENVDFYINNKSTFRRESETQLYFPGHYEHVVQFEGSGPRRMMRRDEPFLLTSPDGNITIEIGKPTPVFCLCLFDTDKINRELRRFAFTFSFGPEEVKPIGDIMKLYTIKVKSQSATNQMKSVSKYHELAEAAIFHFAYGQGVAISLTRTWDRTYYWIGRKDAEDVQFPLRTYNSELVGYYNLALSSDSLVLGYLALYKILEYFYTSVSEGDLHRRIQEHLVLPDFGHNKPKKLRELVRTIRQFDNKVNELESLKLVLSKYFDKAELRRWIEDYDSKNGEYFGNEANVFNSKMRIDTSDNAIFSNIASRIYYIRNALVHGKEGEVSRFIPYTGQEEVLVKEIQLLMHLSEKMIINTGKDL